MAGRREEKRGEIKHGEWVSGETLLDNEVKKVTARVTRLGEFSSIRILNTPGSFFHNRSRQKFFYFFNGICRNMGWVIFWAIDFTNSSGHPGDDWSEEKWGRNCELEIHRSLMCWCLTLFVQKVRWHLFLNQYGLCFALWVSFGFRVGWL
jgi:hypothetical protein